MVDSRSHYVSSQMLRREFKEGIGSSMHVPPIPIYEINHVVFKGLL